MLVKRWYNLIFCFVFIPFAIAAQTRSNDIVIPLSDNRGIIIEGPHRFIEVAGIKGLNLTNLNSKAYFDSEALNSEKGTISLWMSPLESMDITRTAGPSAQLLAFPILRDKFPGRISDSCNFALSIDYYYPRLTGRFATGSILGKMSYGIPPFVYAESLPLRKGQWYNIALTWDKNSKAIVLFVNGQMAGHNYNANDFMKPEKRLFIGNPMMVISDVKITDKVLTGEQLNQEYLSQRPASNSESDETLKKLLTPVKKISEFKDVDKSWKKFYECKFDKSSDLEGWRLQTGELFYDKFKIKVTDEGLLYETPDIIHIESRGYLWCPAKCEGDCRVEYEFKIISPKGLSLVMFYASGMQGEDVIENQGLTKTGSMGDMLGRYSNYHWEFVRRVEAMRTDVETQYVNKNPWGKNLFIGCIPRLQNDTWHKLCFMKTGQQIIGIIDGIEVFNVNDDPYNNNGPVYNSGRVILREMYSTAMIYRNFVIYTKNN